HSFSSRIAKVNLVTGHKTPAPLPHRHRPILRLAIRSFWLIAITSSLVVGVMFALLGSSRLFWAAS
ncbi:MAG: hypothetical protein M5U34_21960, partial [Chloroflexi bacterium]|nr:hypothetical protein [Chloroflexota bacterium]